MGVPNESGEPHSTGLVTIGHVIKGGVLSCINIVLLQEAVLPQSSVAIQVLVTLYSWAHNPGTVTSVNDIATKASHASTAVAVPNEGVDPHSIGLITTGQLMIGAVLS